MRRPNNNQIQTMNNSTVWDFPNLYNTYWEGLFKQMMRILADEDEAADVVQQAFLDLLEMKDKIKAIKSVKSYLFIIARNLAFKKLRQKLSNATYRDYYETRYSEDCSFMEDWIQFKELDNLIQREVDKLPSKMKEVFVLSRNSELSYAEIASELKISDKTVKKQISNAIKILRLQIEKEYQPLLMAFIIADIIF